MMKRLKALTIVAVMLLSLPVFPQGNRYGERRPGVPLRYENPRWAPPYYEGVRYYYLPDIESYYDLSTNEFIFLRGGVWVYSRNIPSMYADFDLDDCFAIVLNVNVFRPWMHHQYYISHYPRYYYRDYYDHSNIPYVRGFDENHRHAIYWGESERHRARNWDNQNGRNGRKFKYTKDDRHQQKNNFDQRNHDVYNSQHNSNGDADRNVRPSDANNSNNRQSTQQADRPRNTNYYGRRIGTPVKVQKQMQERSSGTRQSSDRNSGSDRSSGGESRQSSGRK